MSRHDPCERLNRHHAGELLAIARTLGRQPDATFAKAVRVDPAGVELIVETPTGTTSLSVAFTNTSPGPLRLRLAFRDLAVAVAAGNTTAEPNSNAS